MKLGRGGRVAPVPIDRDRTGPGLYLGEAVVLETERLLRTYGDATEEHEGVVYLGGVETSRGAVALTALSPRAVTTWGSFRTDTVANTDVVLVLEHFGLTLVGQVHSHPGDWVDHSDGDDDGALVRYEGYWSLVVPVFARDGMRPLDRCGVHIYHERQFRRLSVEAVAERVRIVPPGVDLRKDRL